ncbi:MAG: hypothetical protein NTW86_06955 [Candidatus Sumerlaeota bacterium]|nr:hypothetical protein [Candidatus Sumerlaeota bacterium]
MSVPQSSFDLDWACLFKIMKQRGAHGSFVLKAPFERPVRLLSPTPQAGIDRKFPGEEVNRFERRGLPDIVHAVDQVHSLQPFNPQALEASEIPDFQRLEHSTPSFDRSLASYRLPIHT